jgi:hypothetical protein
VKEARTDYLGLGVIQVPKDYLAFRGCMVATDVMEREESPDYLALGVVQVPEEYLAFMDCMVATDVMDREEPPVKLVLLGLRDRLGEMAVMAGEGPQVHVGGIVDRAGILGTPKIAISPVILAIGKHHHGDVHIDAAPTTLFLKRHLGISKSL